MNGVAAQTRRFQAVAIINGVPCNKMIVSPVRSNVACRGLITAWVLWTTRRESAASLQELGWVDGSNAKISAL
jgi:hypothetical protein